MPLATFVSLIPPRAKGAPTGDAKKGFALIKTSGRSMIEMLGVLAIIGVLSAGGIMGYTTAMENYRTNKLIEEIQTAVSGISQTFPKKNNIGSTLVSMEKLIKVGVLPTYYADKLTGTCKEAVENDVNAGFKCWITSPFDKEGRVFMYLINSYRFTVQISQPPKKLCVKFYTHNWGEYLGKTQVWLNLGIGGYNPTFRDYPISVSQAETLCDLAPTSANIAINFLL